MQIYVWLDPRGYPRARRPQPTFLYNNIEHTLRAADVFPPASPRPSPAVHVGRVFFFLSFYGGFFFGPRPHNTRSRASTAGSRGPSRGAAGPFVRPRSPAAFLLPLPTRPVGHHRARTTTFSCDFFIRLFPSRVPTLRPSSPPRRNHLPFVRPAPTSSPLLTRPRLALAAHDNVMRVAGRAAGRVSIQTSE